MHTMQDSVEYVFSLQSQRHSPLPLLRVRTRPSKFHTFPYFIRVVHHYTHTHTKNVRLYTLMTPMYTRRFLPLQPNSRMTPEGGSRTWGVVSFILHNASSLREVVKKLLFTLSRFYPLINNHSKMSLTYKVTLYKTYVRFSPTLV